MSLYSAKAMLFTTVVKNYFNGKLLEGTSLTTEVKDNTLSINVSTVAQGTNIINVPLPFVENGITCMEYHNVKRSVGTFLVISPDGTEKSMDYMDIINSMFCDQNGVVTNQFRKGHPFLQRIATSIRIGNMAVTFYSIQKAINAVVANFPLYESPMHAWAMNKRITIVDPVFNSLQTPQDRLDYQVKKSEKYFDRGWTSIGLSDGVLADQNYILSTSLRSTIPFGYRNHNPQRNLYQTLNMVGDDLPLIKSEYMDALQKAGICRTGWNLFTAFIDLPDNWQDQILIAKSVTEKYVTRTKKIQGFGTILVKEGQFIKRSTPLFVNKEGVAKRFEDHGDLCRIEKVVEEQVRIGGAGSFEKGFTVTVSLKRNIKEGTKITNLAANKGVVKVVDDLGYAIDPRTGEKRRIEVVVSCLASQKRKNYTQLIEAIYNNIFSEKEVIVGNLEEVTEASLSDLLVKNNLPADGAWECVTHEGTFKGIAGKVFWGVTKDVEDMIWEEHDPVATNSKGSRVAGLKFSTVEFRALTTRFGKNNPIIKEIQTYSQGGSDVHELLTTLQTIKGVPIPKKEVVPFSKVRPLLQKEGIFFEKEEILDSIVDEYYKPEGFMMSLPIKFQTIVDKDNNVLYTGIPLVDSTLVEKEARRYVSSHIYIPRGNLRRCWKHDSGQYGLSELGNLVNSLLVLCYKYENAKEDTTLMALLYKNIDSLMNNISIMLGSKKGMIANYTMAVRYPYSIKGVATLSNSLPKNTIQIHTHHAKMLNVKEGDIVLVERFPCLGFMSLRPQKVTITNDSMCYYTIRVSGNSLGSLSLDFDGDVLYVASFHTNEARAMLAKEWANPNKSCYDKIKEHNAKMGKPHKASLTLADYRITPFLALTKEDHATIIEKITGVKSNTGPVVALAYNIMRMVENSDLALNQKVNVAVEVFLDKVANSVFQQKHGSMSLHKIVMEAICVADVATLVKEGFDESTSITICDLIRNKAMQIGVFDLVKFREENNTPIISKIVREQNKVYFTSRSTLSAIKLLSLLESEAVDVPSFMWKYSISNKDVIHTTPLDKANLADMLGRANLSEKSKEAFYACSELIDSLIMQ